MTRHTPKRLSLEDRILWNRVARTADPLPGKTLEEPPVPADDTMDELRRIVDDTREKPALGATASTPKPVSTSPRRIDRPTRTKLARGRLPLGGRVDLHGLTQSEAHGLLLSFLARAHAEGLRHVLVITGKGASFGSEGVLRSMVPRWLATPTFSHLISGFEEASRRHGGAGAFYIRLKRRADS